MPAHEALGAAPPDQGAEHEGRGGSMLSALSNEMVARYKTQLGRGPTKVRSHWAGTDALIVTLEDSLTPAEQRLVEMGEHGRLRDTRTFFQYATANEFIELAERSTKRRVRAFVSGIDTKADVSSEVFYFDPDEELASEIRQEDGRPQ